MLLSSGICEARDDWQLWLEQKWSVGLTKDVKLIGKTEERFQDVYYMIESNKTGRDWNEFHILGLSLSAKF